MYEQYKFETQINKQELLVVSKNDKDDKHELEMNETLKTAEAPSKETSIITSNAENKDVSFLCLHI